MVRCKACGYIMPAGKLHDKCPACGAPKTSFEPYTDPMSSERRQVLNFDLHPIAVHFPISLAVAVFVFSIAIPFLNGLPRTLLIDTDKILSLFIPVTTASAFGLGWIDGKIRFRKILNSQILLTKITYAILLFCASVIQTVIIWVYGFDNAGFTALIVVLGAAASVLVILLGLLGKTIRNAAFPGK
jgi:uncharacterized membrane protein